MVGAWGYGDVNHGNGAPTQKEAVIRINNKIIRPLKIGGLALVLTGILYLAAAFSSSERALYDLQMQLFQGSQSAHPEIVVLMIDDASLYRYRETLGRWPWPRSVYQEVLQFLDSAGARNVAFDILFTEYESPRKSGEPLNSNDQQLVDATAAHQPVIHAMMLSRETPSDLNRELLNRDLPAKFAERFALGNDRRGIQDNNFYIPFTELYEVSSGVGVIEITPDADGAIRRTRLLRSYENRLYPALSLASIIDSVKPKRIESGAEQLKLDSVEVPLDSDGNYLINYYGRYTIYSISKLFASMAALRNGQIDDLPLDPALFKDKIVVVGASAAALVDLKRTPLGSLTPGVFVHAAIISNFLHNDFMSPAAPAITLLLMLLLSGIAVAVHYRIAEQRQRVYWLSGVSGIFILGALVSFYANQQMELLPPILALLLTSLGIRYFENRDLLLFANSGASANALPQSHPATELEAICLILLSEPVENGQPSIDWGPILARLAPLGSRVGAICGDRVELYWPLMGDKAGFVEKLLQLLVKIRKGSKWKMYGGLSLGNISQNHYQIAAEPHHPLSGSAVCRAYGCARTGRLYGRSLLLAQEVYNEVKSLVTCIPVGQVRFSPETEAVEVYRPLSDREHRSAKDRGLSLDSLWREALDHFRQREWDLAQEVLRMLPESSEKRVLETRCKRFRNAPPPENWDGTAVIEEQLL